MMIFLNLHRVEFSDSATRGVLLADEHILGVTLEDRDTELNGARFVKIAGFTAIPLGTYPLIVSPSTRFKCLLPLVCDVREFSGIRIHSGNTHLDTAGCILIGDQFTYDAQHISGSRNALARLMNVIGHCNERGMAQITITNER